MTNPVRPLLYCFRTDLRLSDNPALQAAGKSGKPIVCCYIMDDQLKADWPHGAASRWWLHKSLTALAADLESNGGSLLLKRGNWAEELADLADKLGADEVQWSRGYEPSFTATEQWLHDQLSAKHITSRRLKGYLLFEPEAVRTGAGEPFKVFTPFWKACLRIPEPVLPSAEPYKLNFYQHDLSGLSLPDLRLLPEKPDWSAGFSKMWVPGEKGARDKLNSFLDAAIKDYASDRDVPSVTGTSLLSPHLHFGEISPRQVWHAVQSRLMDNGHCQTGADAFLRELGWREFCYHLLFHWPTLPETSFRAHFDAFPWRKDDESLRAWQGGQTGIPPVDAGMRQLWHSGWMHNRVRMVAASFLTKNLLLDWRQGEKWFWDTLVDADLANNAAGWQWVAGSGADAAPYFRIFNPVTQSKKFDETGAYIKQWAPELNELPAKYVHAPWEAPEEILQNADVNLGNNYPVPIVELKGSRERALLAYKEIKNNSSFPSPLGRGRSHPVW